MFAGLLANSFCRAAGAAILCGMFSLHLPAQTGATPEPNRNAQIEQRLDALVDALDATRRELQESRAEIRSLQQELHQIRDHSLVAGDSSSASAETAKELSDSVANLKEGQEVLQAEVAAHEQSKVETSSKYPLKLNGLILFNSFVNSGTVDNIYAPVVALRSSPEWANGSTGATLRQTILGFNAKGPSIFGAESRSDVRVDFFGDQNAPSYSPSEGMLRLRTAHAELDWPETRLVASLDKPIISPLSPTSFAMVGVSPLAWSGNLWTWLPQLEIAQDLHFGNHHFGIEAAMIDVADPPANYGSVAKPVSAAQRSQYPGSELLLSYSGNGSRRSPAVSVGGYWGPHSYDYGQHTDAWAFTANGMLPLPRGMELSGEFYRGQSLGGLGGGVYKDVIVVKPYLDTYAHVEALNTIGGWAQWKYRMTNKIEWNAAMGEDDGYASQLRNAQLDYTNLYAALARNQTVFANLIYKPSNYLIFSFEYRNIKTWPLSGSAYSAQAYVLTTGYEF